MGVGCDAKTVHRYLRLKLWLSSHRQKRVYRQRREGIVAVAEPNTRWASDITVVKAWNGGKGRLGIVIDCADRQVLAYRWSKSLTGEDIRQMVHEAMMKRFSQNTVPIRGGIEFLSDYGSEYQRMGLKNFLETAGFVVCTTPVRSPESNGIAEAFFKSFKRDYVYQHPCETFTEIAGIIPVWIQDYNTRAPHSALGMISPLQFYENWKLKRKLKVVQN